MDSIEKINPSLKGVLPKIYADPELNKQRLGELIDLIGTIGFNQTGHKAKDLVVLANLTLSTSPKESASL